MPLAVVDVTDAVAAMVAASPSGDFCLAVEHIEADEASNGPIPDGALVVCAAAATRIVASN